MGYVVIGTDPKTTRLASVATVGGKVISADVIDLPRGDIYKGCGLAFRRFAEYLAHLRDSTGHTPFVFLEEPLMAFGKNANAHSTISQSQIGGSVISACEEMLCRCVLVNNRTWKYEVLGDGQIKKENVLPSLKIVWEEGYKAAHGDEDLGDAACLNLFGSMVLRNRKRLLIRRPEKVG